MKGGKKMKSVSITKTPITTLRCPALKREEGSSLDDNLVRVREWFKLTYPVEWAIMVNTWHGAHDAWQKYQSAYEAMHNNPNIDYCDMLLNRANHAADICASWRTAERTAENNLLSLWLRNCQISESAAYAALNAWRTAELVGQ